MPFWPTGTIVQVPTWITPTPSLTAAAGWFGLGTSSATTSNTYITWATNNNTMTTSAQTYGNGLLAQQLYAAQAVQAQQQQAAYERYQLQQYRPIGLGLAWQSAAPALITHQEQARRDQELYRRALAQHDDQEAARLLRQIEARELVAAERQRLLEQQMQQQREDRERRVAASERAGELLLEHLTPQQRETYVSNGWFVVEGGRTKTKYRIRGGTVVANIDVLDRKDHSTHRLCGHAQSHIPMGDQLLSQKIMLELAEDEFLRIANRHVA